nr:unnamed protein product [Spirometra erinaceieuropaei]
MEEETRTLQADGPRDRPGTAMQTTVLTYFTWSCGNGNRLLDTLPPVTTLVALTRPNEISEENLKKLRFYYDRYCARRDPRDDAYGLAAVIQQMKWITYPNETIPLAHVIPPRLPILLQILHKPFGLSEGRFGCLHSRSSTGCVAEPSQPDMGTGNGFDMLPVVMGASRDEYCAIAPPNSFIHVDDFACCVGELPELA